MHMFVLFRPVLQIHKFIRDENEPATEKKSCFFTTRNKDDNDDGEKEQIVTKLSKLNIYYVDASQYWKESQQ